MDQGETSDGKRHLRMGQRAERMAAQYLSERGWEIETRNFTTECGEIDIVARRSVPEHRGVMIAFVEVKSRRSGARHPPELSVTARKRRTITRVARRYADRYGEANMGYRFDVISVDFSRDPASIRHFEGAFDASGNPY